MDDLDFTSARVIEEIQQGLKHLDEEEHNLMMLRGQLTKVKKFREEQSRKDEIISALRERVSSLEYEREFSRKQNAELEEIMTERISALERSLAERDETERQFAEYQIQAELVVMDRDSLKADLDAEMRNHDNTRAENSDLVNQIHRLQTALHDEKQVAANTASLFEALKTELHRKEQTINDNAKKSKDAIQQLSHGLSIARKAVEDMAGKLVTVEEEKTAAQAAAHALSIDLHHAQQEAAASASEMARWSQMYAELEKVVSTLKAQAAAAQQGYTRDLTNLQDELAIRRAELDAAKLELSAQLSTLTSLAGDMASIAALRAPTSMNQLHHHRTEVLAIVRSLKRYVSKLSEPSLVAELYKKMVSFVEEVTLRMLTYHEGLLEHSHSSSEESKRALGLEQSASSLQRDLAHADSAVEKLIQQFQAGGFLYAVNVTDLRAVNMGAARGESLGSEYRSKLYEEVQLGAAAALRKLAELTTDAEEYKRRDAQRSEELRQCVEATCAMKARYTTEIEHLHRMNEEALVAVRVAEYESGTEVNRLKDEYRTKLKQETAGVEEQVFDLQEKVDVMSGKYKQTTVCLTQTVRYTEQLQGDLAQLRDTYSTLKALQRQTERVVGGVDSLAQCCRPNTGLPPQDSKHHPSRHRDVYVFEPFLDPLEEVPMPRQRCKLTFRVAGLHVLAAMRWRRLMRAGKRHRASLTSTGDADFPLPALFALQDKSPAEVALMLQDSLRQHASTASPGGRGGQRAAPRFHLHQEVSMDEFDAYLRNYAYSESEQGAEAGAGVSPSRQQHSRGVERSLLQVLSYGSAGAGAPSGRNVYQLQNLALLYKTLTDMSETISADKDELSQLKVIVTSLESKVRSQEKVVARQDQELRSARAVEEQLRSQLAELEHERRSKSWHLLNEIHHELRQEKAATSGVQYKGKYVPAQPAYEGGFYSGKARAAQAPVDDSVHLEESYVEYAAANESAVDLSQMSLPVPSPSTPEPGHPRPPQDVRSPSFEATPISKTSNPRTPPATNDTLTFTPASGLRESFQDTYKYDPDTPGLPERLAPDLNASGIMLSPPVDWGFSATGTMHSHYSGTDTSEVRSRHTANASARQSTESMPVRWAESSDVSLDSHDHTTLNGALTQNPVAATRQAPLRDTFEYALHARKSDEAMYSTSTSYAKHNREDPLRQKHDSTVSAAYTDIGRLAGKLENRLKKDLPRAGAANPSPAMSTGFGGHQRRK